MGRGTIRENKIIDRLIFRKNLVEEGAKARIRYRKSLSKNYSSQKPPRDLIKIYHRSHLSAVKAMRLATRAISEAKGLEQSLSMFDDEEVYVEVFRHSRRIRHDNQGVEIEDEEEPQKVVREDTANAAYMVIIYPAIPDFRRCFE